MTKSGSLVERDPGRERSKAWRLFVECVISIIKYKENSKIYPNSNIL